MFGGPALNPIIRPRILKSFSLSLRLSAIISFPFTNGFLCPLPIPHLQGLPHFISAEKSINPYRAPAMAVFTALFTVFAGYSVPAIDGQHYLLLFDFVDLVRLVRHCGPFSFHQAFLESLRAD